MIRNLLNLNNRVYATTVVISIAALCSGCNKKDQTPPVAAPATMQTVAKPVQKPVSSVKLTPPHPGNSFDFSGKKDPFKPFVVAKTVTSSNPGDLKKGLLNGLPIHSFDVSQFKLIGIVAGGKDNQAMVVDPNGKGYVLKVGMTIGRNDGRITSISTGGVDVIEQFKDDNGRVHKENIRITLPRKQ